MVEKADGKGRESRKRYLVMTCNKVAREGRRSSSEEDGRLPAQFTSRAALPLRQAQFR